MKFEKKIYKLLNEIGATGAVGGFVGRGGVEIDQLFAGGFHPDSGHGSKNKELLDKQIKDRKKKRADMEKKAYEDDTELIGNPSPIGGYFDVETELALRSYEELQFKNDLNLKYNAENTPPQDVEWKSAGWDYDYDEPGEAYKVRDIEYDDNTGLYSSVVGEIEYDGEPDYYAGENFINSSETNWQFINTGDK
jgi:hypothetical protein